MIKPFLVALQFLTCLPVYLKTQPNEKEIGHSLLYYPLVGLIIGLFLIALGWLFNHTPPLVTAALLITSWVLLTGALHLDGLADSADAWIGGMGDREKTLAIMKDPSCGPTGVVTLILILLLKFVALYSLIIVNEWIAILLASTLARTLIPLLFLTTPYVRSHGLGSPIATHQPRRLSIFIITTIPLLILLFTDSIYSWILIAAILTFVLLRHLMMRRLDGTTGDTAGALIEITETVALLSTVLILDYTVSYGHL